MHLILEALGRYIVVSENRSDHAMPTRKAIEIITKNDLMALPRRKGFRSGHSVGTRKLPLEFP